MSKFLDFFNYASEQGLPLPAARDSSKPGKPPSATLFFMYLSNTLAIASLIYLHVNIGGLTATVTTCIYSVIWTVLYLMRALQKAKFDLENKSFELEAPEENNEEKT